MALDHHVTQLLDAETDLEETKFRGVTSGVQGKRVCRRLRPVVSMRMSVP